MAPREVAEDVEGSDGPTRVLAVAIDATDHPDLGQYHMRRLEGLGDDAIDDMMGELVRAGLAEWTQRPHTAPSGRRNVGLIRPTAAGRRRRQTATDEEHEAKSVRGRIKRATAAGTQLRRAIAESIRDWKTILGTAALVLLVLVAVRGCLGL
ncbi:MAG: hypothetical protein OXF79_24595 [Chloroflexi bacterium]|nr:hypothetical protein [Chloroflexota bacterium]